MRAWLIVALLISGVAYADDTEEATVRVPISTLKHLIDLNAQLRAIGEDALDKRDDAVKALETCVAGRST